MRMNRVLSIIIFAVSLLFVFAFAVQATVETPNTTLEVGEVTVYHTHRTVDLPIYVNNNQGIISALASVTYDPALTLVSVTNENLIVTSYCSDGETLSENPYKIYFSDSLRTTDITENGKLVTLTFELPDDAKAGDEYVVSLSEGKAYNANVSKMPLEYKSGKITVDDKLNITFKDWNGKVLDEKRIEYGETPEAPAVSVEDMGDGIGRAFDSWDTDLVAIDKDTVVTAQYREFVFGDADKDGKLTMIDGIVLARYIASWKGYDETTIDIVAGDVNLDGEAQSDDDIIIWRYLAKWGGYENLPMED